MLEAFKGTTREEVLKPVTHPTMSSGRRDSTLFVNETNLKKAYSTSFTQTKKNYKCIAKNAVANNSSGKQSTEANILLDEVVQVIRNRETCRYVGFSNKRNEVVHISGFRYQNNRQVRHMKTATVNIQTDEFETEQLLKCSYYSRNCNASANSC
ncbi:unnamed protein product [Mytilus coruscus]|uniref:Uncharacterized protein n=1 Tax=Mytilus coruscus TaxID=42192 RepID=A0A6J8BT62_MYTCO|nr:unnamed protein product [Mytilus coruscus]